MRKFLGTFLAILAAVLIAAQAQEPNPVTRLDPSLDQIIPAGAKIEKVVGNFSHLQGLAWARKGGFLYFADNIRNSIYKRTPDGKISVVMEKVDRGFTPDGSSRLGGVNGMTMDAQGRLVYGTRVDHEIVRLEPDGKPTVLASQYEGKDLKAINDMVHKSDGSLYFTDTTWGLRERREKGLPPKKWDIPAPSLFLLKNGKLQMLHAEISSAAGIALSPDEKYLYSNDNNLKMRRYEVQPDGTVANGQIFLDRSADKRHGESDGLKVDQQGNISCPDPGGLWIISPTGKTLGEVKFPQQVAHLAFGDADGKGLYVNGLTEMYKIRLNIPGVHP